MKTLLAEYPFSFSPDTSAVEFEVPTELAKVANPRTKLLWVESGTASFNDTRSDNHERLFEAEQRGIFNVLPRLAVDGGTAPHLREKPLRLLIRVQLNTVPVTLLLKDFGVCRSLLVQPHPLLFGDQSTDSFVEEERMPPSWPRLCRKRLLSCAFAPRSRRMLSTRYISEWQIAVALFCLGATQKRHSR